MLENGQGIYFNLWPQPFSKDDGYAMALNAVSDLIEVHVRIRIPHGPGRLTKQKNKCN